MSRGENNTPLSNCNHQHHHHQQHHIVTCSELHDVWINEIGPKLRAIEIVKLSMVNQWARRIAHTIKHHNGYATVESKSSYCKGVVGWPNLRWELRVWDWSQDDATSDTKWCDVVSLTLNCKISDFSFVETRRLEQFTVYAASYQKFEPRTRKAIASMLVQCTRLASLSLEVCIDEHDNMEWLVNVLKHLTHLSHLSLFGNSLGAERTRRVCDALCHMSHITSLNLGDNKIGTSGVPYVCTALADKHHVTQLELYENSLGSEGVRVLVSCLALLPNLSYLNVFQNRVDGETRLHARSILSHVKELCI